jgi:RNA polymerase sigma factor for flagellar operon FliA
MQLQRATTESPEGALPTELWAAWLVERSGSARNALVLHYRPWLHQIVGRLFGQFRYALADYTDYVNLGAIGLLGAIENYRPEANVPFEAYAYYRVRGAVLNGLVDYASEIGKSVEGFSAGQAYLSEIDAGDEMSDPLGVVVDAVVGLALGRFLELGIVSEGDDQDPLSIYQKEREALDLWALVDRLPQRERLLIVEHYRNQRPFKDLAELLGVSAPRVSQLHYQALRRLRVLYESL